MLAVLVELDELVVVVGGFFIVAGVEMIVGDPLRGVVGELAARVVVAGVFQELERMAGDVDHRQGAVEAIAELLAARGGRIGVDRGEPAVGDLVLADGDLGEVGRGRISDGKLRVGVAGGDELALADLGLGELIQHRLAERRLVLPGAGTFQAVGEPERLGIGTPAAGDGAGDGAPWSGRAAQERRENAAVLAAVDLLERALGLGVLTVLHHGEGGAVLGLGLGVSRLLGVGGRAGGHHRTIDGLRRPPRREHPGDRAPGIAELLDGGRGREHMIVRQSEPSERPVGRVAPGRGGKPGQDREPAGGPRESVGATIRGGGGRRRARHRERLRRDGSGRVGSGREDQPSPPK